MYKYAKFKNNVKFYGTNNADDKLQITLTIDLNNISLLTTKLCDSFRIGSKIYKLLHVEIERDALMRFIE